MNQFRFPARRRFAGEVVAAALALIIGEGIVVLAIGLSIALGYGR
jgi:hypothetical protein